jgi:hypothetical protein
MRAFGVLIAACAATALFVPTAGAVYPTSFEPVASNSAEALVSLPIEGFLNDPATHCQKGARPGTKALAKWLDKTVRGENWGIYRCELWDKGSASLHAEGRALDWRLDVAKPAEKQDAKRVISMLLAPDSAGRPAALARRMGIQEIIWDCRYWGGYSSVIGATTLTKYSACKKGVDKTTAHRNHVHFGLNKRGAMKQTSWWTRVAPPPEYQEGVGSPPSAQWTGDAGGFASAG